MSQEFSLRNEARWVTDKRQMLSYLTDLWQRLGPFDGIMGYSQGAAVAGVFLDLLEMGINEKTHATVPVFKQNNECMLSFLGGVELEG